jgi:hypothetical protein
MIAQEARSQEDVPGKGIKRELIRLQMSGLSIMLIPTLWNKRRAPKKMFQRVGINIILKPLV